MSSNQSQHPLIAYTQSLLESHQDIEAAWLSGSYGRGDNDEYSDFDFGAFVSSPSQAETVFQQLRKEIEENKEVVFSKTLPQSRTINAITNDWGRIDITIVDNNRIADTPREGVKFLYGQDKVENRMRKKNDFDPTKDKADTQNAIYEFIRVLGLLPVVIGRNDYVVGQTGAQLLRDLLVKLMIRENSDGVIRGVLSMRKALSTEQYKALEQVPPISANKDALLKSYKYLAAEFFARGKRVSRDQGLVWPTRFEDAARRTLQAKLGLTI